MTKLDSLGSIPRISAPEKALDQLDCLVIMQRKLPTMRADETEKGKAQRRDAIAQMDAASRITLSLLEAIPKNPVLRILWPPMFGTSHIVVEHAEGHLVGRVDLLLDEEDMSIESIEFYLDEASSPDCELYAALDNLGLARVCRYAMV